MEITVTKTQTVEEKINVDFPFYRKSRFGNPLKFISPTEGVIIYDSFICTENSFDEKYLSSEYSECTPEEFNTAFDKTLQKLIDLKNK